MIGRLLLWVLLGMLAWWMLRPARRAPPPPARPAAGARPEEMVDCARCGLHFPASEGVRDGARAYCCAAHRDAGPAA